jgi:adenylate cyclase
LGIFPIEANADSSRACMDALKAAVAAFQRLDELNLKRRNQGEAPLDFGVGLHVGDVLFGNIGVPQRLEFTVIGPAMNEAARLEALTKELNANILTSERFIAHLDQSQCQTIGRCTPLGEHVLRGVDEPMSVYEFFDKTK